MLIRMYAAGLTVVIAMLFTLTPADAFARSGGFGGRSFAMAQGFRAPAFRQSLGFRSAVFRQSLAFRSRIWRQSLFDRGRYGLGALWARLGGSYYDPSDYFDSYYQPSYAGPNIATAEIPGATNLPVIYRRGCESQTISVPSEDGGERSINIVRCYYSQSRLPATRRRATFPGSFA